MVCRGGSRIFFSRGCTRLLLYFNTNKPQFFCRIPVLLENRRSSRGAGCVPLHPPPRSAPGLLQCQKNRSIGHFRVPKNLTFTARLSAKPLIWKWFLIIMQIKIIFTTKVSHLASFWKWDFLELGNGLFNNVSYEWQNAFLPYCFSFYGVDLLTPQKTREYDLCSLKLSLIKINN